MAVVKAPNQQYTGTSAGVAFVNGIGQTEKTELLAWFREHGYQVEEEPAAFVCPQCGKEYKTEKGLADHLAREHPEFLVGENPPAGEE